MYPHLPAFDLVRTPPKRGGPLLIVPVYNEMPHLAGIIQLIRQCWDGDILAVDDDSTDDSLALLKSMESIHVIHNHENAGAGGVLLQGFAFAFRHKYRSIITLDADGQHSPFLIKDFFREIQPHYSDQESPPLTDFIWGSRYMQGHQSLSPHFQARQEVNKIITSRLNEITGLNLSDAFCGFRAYRTEALRRLPVTETGYGMFLQMAILAWQQSVAVRDIPVPLVYLDEARNFQSQFRDTRNRLAYYNSVIDAALSLAPSPSDEH